MLVSVLYVAMSCIRVTYLRRIKLKTPKTCVFHIQLHVCADYVHVHVQNDVYMYVLFLVPIVLWTSLQNLNATCTCIAQCGCLNARVVIAACVTRCDVWRSPVWPRWRSIAPCHPVTCIASPAASWNAWRGGLARIPCVKDWLPRSLRSPICRFCNQQP